jgi:GcrA cell cycle regulator
MAWTDERIDQLRQMWQNGMTASQIAEQLGGVSRNAVIGKAHRLGLQSRPSPVSQREAAPAPEPVAAPVAAAAPEPPAAPPPPPQAAAPAPAPTPVSVSPFEEADEDDADDTPVVAAAPVPEAPIVRSIGPGGFARQNHAASCRPSPRPTLPARPACSI